MTPPVIPPNPIVNPPATHGKDGVIFMSTSAAGTLEPLSLMTEFTLDTGADTVETTAFGSPNKTYVRGLQDMKGTFTGFWDSTADTLFDAADSPDGVKMQIYPSWLVDKNWGGPAWVSVSLESGVSKAVGVKGSFVANGAWVRDAARPA